MFYGTCGRVFVKGHRLVWLVVEGLRNGPATRLRAGEQPPAALWAFVAEQLELDGAYFGVYAERDQTRREHVLEIETALGLRPLTRVLYRELAAWLLPTALATDHGPTLVATLLEELRARRIVCPSLPAIERLAGSVRARAQRRLWRRLADGLTAQQRRHAPFKSVLIPGFLGLKEA